MFFFRLRHCNFALLFFFFFFNFDILYTLSISCIYLTLSSLFSTSLSTSLSFSLSFSQNAPAEKPQVFNYSQSHIIGHLDKDTSGYSTILSAAEQEKDKFAQGFEISSQDFVNRNVNTPTWKAFLTESHRFIIQPPCSERIVTSGKER